MAKKSKPLIGTGKCGTVFMGPGFGEALHEEIKAAAAVFTTYLQEMASEYVDVDRNESTIILIVQNKQKQAHYSALSYGKGPSTWSEGRPECSLSAQGRPHFLMFSTNPNALFARIDGNGRPPIIATADPYSPFTTV
ncbi:Uncharacterized protein Fot_02061 [Forsythia ovata]|uniref:Uncharacterized protein n=1 Tax=Forsythia ovata TaxID=205694 RepID=A0ABD1X5Q7_9LAMI